MSRETKLEKFVRYEDELSELRKAGKHESEEYKKLEEKFNNLRELMPKYRPHVYENVRTGKNKSIKK